jgi:hypothetical protein
MKAYVIERLKEASTWRGIIMLLTAAGIPMAPEMQHLVISVGMALAGAVGVAMPDK